MKTPRLLHVFLLAPIAVLAMNSCQEEKPYPELRELFGDHQQTDFSVMKMGDQKDSLCHFDGFTCLGSLIDCELKSSDKALDSLHCELGFNNELLSSIRLEFFYPKLKLNKKFKRLKAFLESRYAKVSSGDNFIVWYIKSLRGQEMECSLFIDQIANDGPSYISLNYIEEYGISH